MSRRKKVPAIPFPEECISPFFVTGLCKVPVPARLDVRALTPTQLCHHFDVRSILYFLLLCFGLLRSSEPLHLFLSDIVFDFENGSGARVILRHPANGYVRGPSGVWVDRRSFLLTEFGRVPRNVVRGSSRVGWKDLMLDENGPSKSLQSRVYWIIPEIGQLFWFFHQAYVQCGRPRSGNHPYYFVSAWGDAYGEPWSLGSADDTFERALGKIGLKPVDGLCKHSFRQGGVHFLRIRDVSPALRQLVLHHNSIESQEDYGRLTPSEVADVLRAATAPGASRKVVYADLFPKQGENTALDRIGRELVSHFMQVES